MRGLIISPDITIGEHVGIQFNTWRHEMINFWAVYWDELFWPQNNNFNLPPPNNNDFEMLKKVGIFKSPYVESPNPFMMGSNEFPVLLKNAWSDLEKQNAGSWAFSMGENALKCPDFEDEDKPALQIRLVNALPVPHPDVPLDRVLSFKDRHVAERDAIWSYLDELLVEIQTSGDLRVGELSAHRRLNGAIEDQLNAARQSNSISEWNKGGLTASLGVEPVVAFADAINTGSSVLGVLASVASAAIAVSWGPSLRLPFTRTPSSPVAYATHIEGRLNWDQ